MEDVQGNRFEYLVLHTTHTMKKEISVGETKYKIKFISHKDKNFKKYLTGWEGDIGHAVCRPQDHTIYFWKEHYDNLTKKQQDETFFHEYSHALFHEMIFLNEALVWQFADCLRELEKWRKK